MADNEIRNPAKAYFKWKMPVITKSEDDWNFWNTEDKYNRTLFIGYNDTTTPHVASLFMIVDGKPMQAVGDDIIARIASLETNTAQALADIQALIARVNAQQLEISNLQQECERVLARAADAVEDARTWAEGTDEDVADLGGEHSAKGWAQKASDIVASGLPSDASFEHITVTGNSKFGQDPDRENQPGLEIEGTGEIQAYRTVNMHNGATIEYDGTVDMPWSDSSTKVPNTKWVQDAIIHGSGVDPNADITCQNLTVKKNISLGTYDTMGYNITTEQETIAGTVGASLRILQRAISSTKPLQLRSSFPGGGYGELNMFGNAITLYGHVSDSKAIQLNLTIGNAHANYFYSPQDWPQASKAERGCITTGLPFVINGGSLFLYSEPSKPDAVLCALGGMTTGVGDINGYTDYAMLFQRKSGKHEIDFGVTPTVPDITDAADSSSKVPNTKWVQECITTLTADLQPKLTAGDGIEISADNVISVTGGGTGGGAVSSVNGKTGEVVLEASDLIDSTTDLTAKSLTAPSLTIDGRISATSDMTYVGLGARRRGGFAMTVTGTSEPGVHCTLGLDVTGVTSTDTLSVTGDTTAAKVTAASIYDTAEQPAADASTTRVGTTAWVQSAIDAKLANYATTVYVDTKLKDVQPKLTAGDGITISADNVISATGGGGSGGGAVDSVNGKTGAVVLTGEDIKTSSYPESATIVTTFASFAQMIETKQDKITATTALTARSYDTDVGTYYTHIGENGLQVNDSSAVNQISLNMDDGLITPTKVSFTGADKTFTVAGTSIFNGKAAFTKPVTTTNTVSMLNGNAPLLSVGASGVKVNLTNATKFDCYTSADGTDTSVCTITDGGVSTNNATLSSTLTVNSAAFLSRTGNLFDAGTTYFGELKTTSNVTSTLWGADGEQTVLSLDTTGQTFKVSSVGGTDMLNCNLATGMVNLPGMTLTPADGESSATINAYVPITAKSIASTDAASLQGGFISTGYSAIQGVMGLFFQDDDWTTYAIISPSNTSFADLVLTDEIPPGDNSNRATTTAWVKNAITTAVQTLAGGPSKNDSVTTASSGSITSRTYTIYKNGNLWSIHVTVTLNTSTLNNGTNEEWAFLSSVSNDADLTKLLAGQVLFMNAYISGHDGTTAAQNGYNAIGVTTTRLDGGELKAVVRSFDSAVTDIPAGLELSFDLTTWVSN